MTTNVWKHLSSILALGIFALLATGTTDMPNPKETYTVQYRVTGTARAVGITISVEGGGTEQHEVSIPYTSPAYTLKGWEHAYVSAQNKGGSGTVTAEIVVNGMTKKRASSSGPYSIASVSWLVGSKD